MSALDRGDDGHYVYWSPLPLIIRMSASRRGVDVGIWWAYKRGPFGGFRIAGMLIEIVEKREGMRGRRPDRRKAGGAAGCSCIYANVWRPLIWVRPRGWAWDELESLILAQNERWRHA